MRCEVYRVDWPLKAPFRVAYRTRTHAQTIVVELSEAGARGRGEALGVSYHGESVDSLRTQILDAAVDIGHCASRQDLQQLLPPGGARNAVDCAMWDLEAKRTGRRVWDLAGIPPVGRLLTAYTLSIDDPGKMALAAQRASSYTLLKLKLNGEEDIERVRAVRLVRPDARLIVDANQAWGEEQLHHLTPQLAALGVELIEQPLPAGADGALRDFNSPVPLCADESCQTLDALEEIAGKYDYINIKLDKTGGLTEALRLAAAARALDLELMVGCMAGSSLSMAPAFVVGQLCKVIDLDGPLLASADVANGIRYEGSWMHPPERQLWG